MGVNAGSDSDSVHAGARVGHRRLAAIAFTDIVGYSRLMELDDVGTHARWMTMRQAVIKPCTEAHFGNIVKSTGDGYLVEFRSALDAVRWAFAVQDGVKEREPEGAPAAIQLRIAIHLGDVITEADDIFGDGVNIAARLQEFAPPGGVLISGAVHDQVSRAVSYNATDLGLLSLKHLERPVRAYLISSDRDIRPLPGAVIDAARKPSIAVLPLRSLSDASEDRYFAEGVVHDIVASLASLHEIFVVSSSSTVNFAGANADASTIGRHLRVRYVMTGSLARKGNRLRIQVELSDVDNRSVIWTDRYEADGTELFSLQDKIATKLAYSLVPHLRNSELQRALRKRPENMDAYDLVLQALHRFYRLDVRDFTIARELLLQAIDRDPRYATAYALLAKWYIIQIGQGYTEDHRVDAREAARYATLALEHDSSDPLALAVYGHTLSFLFGEYDRAISAFDAAIAGSPNSAIAWGLSSPTYSYMGDGAAALTRAEYALRLSPLDPCAFYYQTALTLAHYTNGTYEEAARWGRRSMALNPRFTANMRPLIGSLVALERLDEARSIAAAMLALEPNFRVDAYCSWYPIKDRAHRQLYAERLIAAGLPR